MNPTIKPADKPRGKVERMFGDCKTRMPGAAQNRPQLYKGFLLVECEHCGRRKGFYTTKALSSHLCKCGEETKLRALRPLYLRCKCGKSFRYQTNLTDETVEYFCLECGCPVDLTLNKKGSAYVALAEREE